jgi:hypothetical protein
MAKKSRRVRRKSTQPKLSQTQLAQPSQATLEAREVVEEPAEEPTASSGEVDYEKEYHYVVTDLRRLVVLAAAILAGIIVLSIIL